jgi:GATA-binding protein 6
MTTESESPFSSITTVHSQPCSLCGIKDTPIWRRNEIGHPVCNSCGLWSREKDGLGLGLLTQLVKDRLSKKGQSSSNHHQESASTKHPSPALQKGPCSNCATTDTCFWRRNDDGTWLCNACGVYYRMKGISRPVILNKRKKRTCLKPPKRRRSSLASSLPTSLSPTSHSSGTSPLSQRSEDSSLYSLATAVETHFDLVPLVNHHQPAFKANPIRQLPSFQQFLHEVKLLGKSF